MPNIVAYNDTFLCTSAIFSNVLGMLKTFKCFIFLKTIDYNFII